MKSLAQLTRSGADPLVLPGVFDAFSARLAEQAGAQALFATGAGITNARLGVPDLGFIGLSELCDVVRNIAEVVTVPVVVDADTGFGNAVSVTRTVRLLESAGASAIQLEDQESPKKCGHFGRKAVIATHEMQQKVRAAVHSRRSESTLVIARTDALDSEGLDKAIDRAVAYKNAGADLIFIEAPETVDQLREIGRRAPRPLVVNMVEGGLTPTFDTRQLGEMGFAAVIYANAALRMAQAAMSRAYSTMLADGGTEAITGLMATWQERQEAVGKPQFDALDKLYA
jgi:2-methylisocitrate lyase-like PEP mutase family enzyme